MDLTDEQWALLQPLILSTKQLSSVENRAALDSPESNCCTQAIRSSNGRTQAIRSSNGRTQAIRSGRPLLDDRPILDGIIWKIRTRSPWYDMPSRYPSHQTCYRRYRQWDRLGVMTAVFRALYLDLRERGGLDLQAAFRDGAFRFQCEGLGLNFVVDPRLHNTWQLSTALLLLAWMPRILKANTRRPPSTLQAV